MRHRFSAIALAATLTLAGGACADRPDPDDMAEEALTRWGIDGVEADYDEDAKVVRLTGTVGTEDQKQNAEESVRAAVGRTATIQNDISVDDTRATQPTPSPAPAPTGQAGRN
jgi:hypothetical protein